MSEVKTEPVGVLAEYSAIQAELTKLKKTYAGKVYDVSTTAGLKAAKIDRAVLRTGRTDVEKVRKALKAPHLDLGRKIDSDAKMIMDAFTELAEPVSALIKEEEDRKAVIKAEKDRIEKKRIEDIQFEISEFNFLLSEYHPSEDIQAFVDKINAVEIGEQFGEFQDMAHLARDKQARRAAEVFSLAKTREDKAAAVQLEQENTKKMLKQQADAQAAERAKLDAQKAEQEKTVDVPAPVVPKAEAGDDVPRCIRVLVSAIAEVADEDVELFEALIDMVESRYPQLKE